MYKENDVWYVGHIYNCSWNGKTLAEAVKHDSYFVIEHLTPMCRTDEQQDAIEAEIERQAGPKTFVAGCPVCGHTTRHTLDTGCVQCVAYKEAGK